MTFGAPHRSSIYLRVIKSGKVRWEGHIALMGDSTGFLVRRPEGKRPLSRPNP